MTLTEKRLKALSDARTILDTAKAAGRAMSADEVRRYDAFMADSDAIKAMIDRENAANALDAAARDNVPTAIRDNGAASSEDSAPVLTKEQRCVDAIRKAGCAYASETARGERFSLGKIVVAMATVFRAGAQTVPMTSDIVNIARLASGPTLAWKAEADLRAASFRYAAESPAPYDSLFRARALSRSSSEL